MTKEEAQKLFDAGDIGAIVSEHSAAIQTLENIWDAAAQHYGKTEPAYHAAMMKAEFVRLHNKANILALQFADVPLPKSGGR